MFKKALTMLLAILICSLTIGCDKSNSKNDYESQTDESTMSNKQSETPTISQNDDSSKEIPRTIPEKNQLAKSTYKNLKYFIDSAIAENKKENLPHSVIVTFYTNKTDTSEYADINNKLIETVGDHCKIVYEVNSEYVVQYVKLWDDRNEKGVCGEYTLNDYNNETSDSSKTNSSDLSSVNESKSDDSTESENNIIYYNYPSKLVSELAKKYDEITMTKTPTLTKSREYNQTGYDALSGYEENVRNYLTRAQDDYSGEIAVDNVSIKLNFILVNEKIERIYSEIVKNNDDNTHTTNKEYLSDMLLALMMIDDKADINKINDFSQKILKFIETNKTDIARYKYCPHVEGVLVYDLYFKYNDDFTIGFQIKSFSDFSEPDTHVSINTIQEIEIERSIYKLDGSNLIVIDLD